MWCGWVRLSTFRPGLESVIAENEKFPISNRSHTYTLSLTQLDSRRDPKIFDHKPLPIHLSSLSFIYTKTSTIIDDEVTIPLSADSHFNSVFLFVSILYFSLLGPQGQEQRIPKGGRDYRRIHLVMWRESNSTHLVILWTSYYSGR